LARIAQYILLASLILLFIIKGLIPAWQDIHSDFPNYYTSSRLLIEGEDISKIYDSDWFQKKAEEYGMGQHSRFSPFPPATAFLMLPIAWLEPLSAKRIWTALNLLVLVATVYLLRQLTQWNYMQCGILLFHHTLVQNIHPGKTDPGKPEILFDHEIQDQLSCFPV